MVTGEKVGVVITDLNFAQFKTRAEAVSAEVHRFYNKAEAVEFICQFVQKESPGDAYALWADCSFLKEVDKQRLHEQAPSLRFIVSREQASGARIGISQMDWGIANTGTLVQNASGVEQRLVSTLPLIHVALLETANIVADLPALLTKINPMQSNYISFITGPSRTADIERVLTIGVHGPERVVIVCVDELGAIA